MTTANENDSIELHGMLASFKDALEAEIKAIDSGKAGVVNLSNGKEMMRSMDDYRYRFHVDYVDSIVPDTPCQLVIDRKQIKATIISCEDTSVVISCNQELEKSQLGKVTLKTGSSQLMRKLIERIEEKSSTDNKLGDLAFDSTLFSRTQLIDSYSCENSYFNDEQKEAVESAINKEITFIWGPPGTGKTQVISAIIHELLKKDKKVLLASHTNTAVDNALKRVDKSITDIDFGIEWPLLRLGIPSEPLEKRLTEGAHIDALSADLYSKKEGLQNTERLVTDNIANSRVLLDKAKWLKEFDYDHISSLHEEYLVAEKSRQERKDAYQEAASSFGSHFNVISAENAEKLVAESEQLNNRLSIEDNVIKECENEEYRIQEGLIRNSDEKKKYALYEKLKKQDDSMLSINTQKEDYKKKKQQYEDELEKLEMHKAALLSINAELTEINNAGSLRQLFLSSRKRELDEDKLSHETVVKEIEMTIPSIERVLSKLKEELDNHLAICEQMEDLKPKRSLSELNNEASELEIRNEKNIVDLKKHKSEKEKIEQRLAEIESEISETNLDLIQYRAEKKMLNEYQLLANEADDDYLSVKNRLTNSIKSEIAETSLFSYDDLDLDDPEELFTMINDIKKSYSEEVGDFDFDSLKNSIDNEYARLQSIKNEIKRIDDEIEDIKHIVKQHAKVIGTTLTKTYLDSDIQSMEFDAIIIDEASMAALPALWCALSVSKGSATIVGDFMQLPPVVLSSDKVAQDWLGTDIFKKNGIVEKLKSGTSPDCFIALTKQYRMQSEIARIPNQFYADYNTRLESFDLRPERIDDKESFDEWFLKDSCWESDHHSVRFVDTKSLHAWATGVPGSSRCNYLNATTDVMLAFDILDKRLRDGKDIDKNKALILIVTPYKPQMKLIDRMLHSEFKERDYLDFEDTIKVGTVHSFQGQEADVVIFDLVVDDPHSRYVNLFTPANDESNIKMYNVAASRSKFALFMVGNISFLRTNGKNAAIRKMIDGLIDNDTPVYDAKELYPTMSLSHGGMLPFDGTFLDNCIVTDGDTFIRYFYRDIDNSNQEIIIYAPFLSKNRLSEEIPLFLNAIQRGVRIKVFTKTVEELNKSQQTSHRECINALREHGLDVVVKKNMHEKIILIDKTIVWVGSLNALSYNGETSEFMQRVDSKEFYGMIEKYEDLGKLDINEVTVCPVCGMMMNAREGRKGDIYWECPNDGLTWSPDKPFPRDGILVCKSCGNPLQYKRKKDPRWVCSENGKHYQNVKWSELKLPKMRKQISKEEMRFLIDFFGKSNSDYKKEILGKETRTKKKNEDNSDEQISLLDLLN